MTPTPSTVPIARDIPPDLGGRCRFLVRGIAIACVLLAVVAVVLLIGLSRGASSPSPRQQQQRSNGGGGHSRLTCPAVVTTRGTGTSA